MITAEMRNMMIRDQLMNDLAEIKSDMIQIKQEILELKLALESKKEDTGWRRYED